MLLSAIDEAFSGGSWHGPSLRASLRGVDQSEAAWRPAPRRHNIWELVVHAAYWKHIVSVRVTGSRERFPYAGSNWFRRPARGASWEGDLRLLQHEHQKLRDLVSALNLARLGSRVHGRADTVEHTIRGIAAHDIYHAGQIQLLRRLRRRGA